MVGKTSVHYYEVVGRKRPTEADPKPKILRMTLFARNPVRARSRFWYFVRQLTKLKRANGEILLVREQFEKNPNIVKNYGIWIRYDSRTGTHNMYKEFRALTLTDAVEKLYTEMASLHRCKPSSIQIIRHGIVAASDTKRPPIKQFHNSRLAFPHPHQLPRAPHKSKRTAFKAIRPSTYH